MYKILSGKELLDLYIQDDTSGEVLDKVIAEVYRRSHEAYNLKEGLTKYLNTANAMEDLREMNRREEFISLFKKTENELNEIHRKFNEVKGFEKALERFTSYYNERSEKFDNYMDKIEQDPVNFYRVPKYSLVRCQKLDNYQIIDVPNFGEVAFTWTEDNYTFYKVRRSEYVKEEFVGTFNYGDYFFLRFLAPK